MAFKTFLRFTFLCALLVVNPTNGIAGKGQNLPLDERIKYYEKKAEEHTDPKKKEKCEEKCIAALDDLVQIQEDKRIRKANEREKVLAQGVDGRLKCATKERETFVKKYNPPERGSPLRKVLNNRDDFEYLGRIYSESGGHFRILQGKEIAREEAHEMGFSFVYALKYLSDPLEVLTGLSKKQISGLCNYGLTNFLDLYFDCVEEPHEGDLVVYKKNGLRHAGICRFKENNIPVVESWFRISDNLKIFEHDVFVVPEFYGNHAFFYRLKSILDLGNENDFPQTSSMANLREDGTFIFDSTLDNLHIREIISKTDLFTLSQVTFQGLLHIKKNIEFFGTCFWYAMGLVFKTYECPDKIPYFETNREGVRNIFETYFDVTHSPKKGDLVVYYSMDPHNHPTSFNHFGMYLGNHMVESKWGRGYVVIHPLFHVNKEYGRFVQILEMIMSPEEILQKLDMRKNN